MAHDDDTPPPGPRPTPTPEEVQAAIAYLSEPVVTAVQVMLRHKARAAKEGKKL